MIYLRERAVEEVVARAEEDPARADRVQGRVADRREVVAVVAVLQGMFPILFGGIIWLCELVGGSRSETIWAYHTHERPSESMVAGRLEASGFACRWTGGGRLERMLHETRGFIFHSIPAVLTVVRKENSKLTGNTVPPAEAVQPPILEAQPAQAQVHNPATEEEDTTVAAQRSPTQPEENRLWG